MQSPQPTNQDSVSASFESEMLLEESTNKTPLETNVKCSCGQHNGKEMLNQIFNLNVNYLWECLFGQTEFRNKYWESRKFGSIKVSDWSKTNALFVRQLEYTVDLGGTMGKAKNNEDQVRFFLFNSTF